MVIALDSVGTKAKSLTRLGSGRDILSLSPLSITHISIRGAALHVVVVIVWGMSPVLVGFSHTLPDGLLLLSRDGTIEARDLLEGATLRPSTRRRGNQYTPHHR